jgi:hypothetical protein
LNAEKALDEFIELSVNILEKHEMDAAARMAALEIYVGKLLRRYDMGEKTRLLDANLLSKGSKMYVMSYSIRQMRADE